jgi:RES domain-containing protein
MTVPVWRIAVEAPTHSADDMTGTGAKLSGGRWNNTGTPVVYCAENISLATLETLGYLRAFTLPFNRFLVRVDVPDAIWGKREILDPLPGDWDAVPSGRISRVVGDAWCVSNRSALLIVPSVIVPDETNILINPAHPDATAISAHVLKRWIYDSRFF